MRSECKMYACQIIITVSTRTIWCIVARKRIKLNGKEVRQTKPYNVCHCFITHFVSLRVFCFLFVFIWCDSHYIERLCKWISACILSHLSITKLINPPKNVYRQIKFTIFYYYFDKHYHKAQAYRCRQENRIAF